MSWWHDVEPIDEDFPFKVDDDLWDDIFWSDTDASFEEHKNWLAEQGLVQDKDWQYKAFGTYRFKVEADAVLFKLRWA